MKITVAILAHNEEKNIRKCLESFLSLPWVGEIVVIDDYSVDETVKIAEDLGAKIYKRKLAGDFAAARNYTLSKSLYDWTLFVDSDERISSELADEISRLELLKQSGYSIKRVDHLWGKSLRYGDVSNVWLTRLVKKGTGKWERRVHEVWIGKEKAKIGRLSGVINHYPHQSVGEFIESVRKYALLHSRALQAQGKVTNVCEVIFYPVGKFILNYLVKLGLLDGTAGFVHAMIMSFHSFIARAELLIADEK